MNKYVIILASVLLLLFGVFLAFQDEILKKIIPKDDEKPDDTNKNDAAATTTAATAATKDEPIKSGNFTGAINGISMSIGAAIMLVVVLVGTIVLLLVYGTAKATKAVAADPDKAIDRGVRASEIVRNIRSRR